MTAKWDRLGTQAKPARADADTSDRSSRDAHRTELPAGKSGSEARGDGTPHPSTEKVSGAGPSIAEHSKDAKAPRGGRQPGAYVKTAK